MKVEAGVLRVADVVRVPGGEQEVARVQAVGGDVFVWFRGDEQAANDDPEADEGPKPSVVYDATRTLDVKRPGDLFAGLKSAVGSAKAAVGDMFRFKPPLSPRQKMIVDALVGLGWRYHADPGGADHLHDAVDMVRVEFQGDRVVMFVRERTADGWTWPDEGLVLGTLEWFAADFEKQIAKLQTTSILAQWEREEAERSRPKTPVPDVSTLPRPQPGQPVIVRYSRSEGILLCGSTYQNRKAIGRITEPFKFRFSRKLPSGCAWYVPRSRSTEQPREVVEAVVASLREAGVAAELDYVAPDSETTPTSMSAAHGEAPDQPAAPRRSPGRPPDRKVQAERLRAVAKRILDDAEQTIGQARNENTVRRARIAAGIRSRAFSEQVIAGAIMLAADEVEAGRLTYVARLSTRPQVDDLEYLLARARDARRRQADERVEDGREPELADVPFARFSGVTIWRDNLRRLIELGDARINAGQRRALRKLSEGPDEAVELIEPTDVDLVRPLFVRKGQPGYDRVMEIPAESLARYDRMARLGIHDTTSLRAALREYLGCCRGSQQRRREDPIAAKKRDLRFAKIPGYFPTPRGLAERMVELAEIEPGMRVLEPSAGSGSIAEVIRDEHPGARLHVLEIHDSLRSLLSAQGFALVGFDFMNFQPSEPYDRIIMNPPFERRQDVGHIERALGMLAPGGRLVAIASGSFEGRSDRETVALRGTIERLGGTIERVPAGAFSDSGTDVATVLIVVDSPAAKVASRPALSVVRAADGHQETRNSQQQREPVEKAADCACKHPPDQLDAADQFDAPDQLEQPEAPKPRKPRARKAALKPSPIVAAPVVTAPVVAAPIVREDAPRVGAPERRADGTLDVAGLLAHWEAETEQERAALLWRNIPKTSCFEIHDDAGSVTMCAAYQLRPVGDCPPMKRKTPSLAVCSAGEAVEYFARGVDDKSIHAAKAEGNARLPRSRPSEFAGEFDRAALPSGGDRRELQAYLDRLVPSRIVTRRGEPLEPIEVRPARPVIVTLKGERLPLASDTRVVGRARLDPQVDVGGEMSLASMVAALDSGALVPYRGSLSHDVLVRVLDLASGNHGGLIDEGITLDDVRFGVVGGHTVYWLRTPSGKLYGPITATGQGLNASSLARFRALYGPDAKLEPIFPAGWDRSKSVSLAFISNGRPMFLAWHAETSAVLRCFVDETEWTPADSMPRRSKWAAGQGFADFPHAASWTMRAMLERLPADVHFRVAGAWLGVLWPSDFGNRVDFDPPTGGTIDLDEVRADYAERVSLAADLRDAKEDRHAATLEGWAEIERARVRWAAAWLRKNDTTRTTDKPKRERKPKTDKPKLAVVPAAGEQDQAMSTPKRAKKGATKKAAAKKSEPEKAKKAAGKKAAKKATAKPATAKRVEPKTTKKATSKKAASKASEAPVKKVEPPKPSPCETSDDSCALDSWRNRIKQGDRVRFRKNSTIAASLGIKTDRVFEVRCTVCRDGQRLAILDLGMGSANDVAIPVGQFAVVDRAPDRMPADVRDCVAKLATHRAKLPPELRAVVARLAGGG